MSLWRSVMFGKERRSAAVEWMVSTALVLVVSAVAGTSAAADAAKDAREAEQLVDQAKSTVGSFDADSKMMGKPVRDLVKKAKGVYIAPSVLRGAFIVGVSGGSGVLLVRGDNGQWNGPAFYTIGEASFGLAAGVDKSEVMLLIMTDRGVSSMLKGNVKLGADASVAAGPVGGGATAETANLSADILSFSRAKGLYGGVSLEGAVVAKREGLNEAYYHKPEVTPTDILIKGTPTNQQAAPLKTQVDELAKSK